MIVTDQLIEEIEQSKLDADLDKACYATLLESLSAGATRTKLEEMAARIGLSQKATSFILDHWEARHKALHDAHLILKTLKERIESNGRRSLDCIEK